VYSSICVVHIIQTHKKENKSYTHYESSILCRISIYSGLNSLCCIKRRAISFFFLRVVIFYFFFSAVLRLNSYKNYFEVFLGYFLNEYDRFDVFNNMTHIKSTCKKEQRNMQMVRTEQNNLVTLMIENI
jgi:hypothetical protein